MKRVLITGGSGFLGARILQQGLGDAELCSLPRGFLAAAGEAEVTETIQKLQPAAIVHAAALSDTGYCAQHPEEAHRANVELPVWVAKAACASGAKLLAFSSDQVYAGITQPGPLPETLPLQPTNVYGRCKLEMEQRVLELCPDAVLLRASWMYDLPGYGLPIRGNLPLNLLRAALHGTSVTFSANDCRGVTYVRQVIANLAPALSLAACTTLAAPIRKIWCTRHSSSRRSWTLRCRLKPPTGRAIWSWTAKSWKRPASALIPHSRASGTACGITA